MTIEQYNNLKIGDKIYWKDKEKMYEISSFSIDVQFPMFQLEEQSFAYENYYHIFPSKISLFIVYKLEFFL